MKQAAVQALKVLISLALLYYLLGKTDSDALLQRLRGADTLVLAGAVLLYMMMLVISVWRWRLLLQAQGHDAPMKRLSASYLVATFFNNFLPSNIGGDVIRVRDSSRLTGSTTTALAVVAIDRIIGLGALYVLALTAYIFGGPDVRHLTGARLVIVGLGLFFGYLAYVFFRPGQASRMVAAVGLARSQWAIEHFETVQASVHVYRQRVGAVWAAFAASVALQTIVICYYFAIAQALRIELPLAACFLMVPLCVLVQTVPVSFNGWGIREAVFVHFFRQIGLPGDSAIAFSLLGAGLIVLLSLSGAVVWMSRPSALVAAAEAPAEPSETP
jgi:uncharacterized protein (TIRG00374 family)